MFWDRHNGDRFFARVLSFELACPRCNEVARVTEHTKDNRSIFDRKKSIFSCRGCSLHLAIGLIAWPLRNGPTGMPGDTVPTYREAMQLREFIGPLMGTVPDEFRRDAKTQEVIDQRHGAREPVNVVIKGECRCRRMEPRGKIIHPDCPIHGDAAGKIR